MGGQEHTQRALQESKVKGARKAVKPFTAWCLTIGCIIRWSAFSMPGSTFLPEAGPLGAAIAIVLGALAVSVVALNYRFMAGKMPVDGGAFAYARESFGYRHGYVCAWALVLAYIVVIPANASVVSVVSHELFGAVLEVGPYYSLFGYTIYATEVLMQVGVLLIVGLVLAGSSGVPEVTQNGLVIVMIGAIIIAVVVGMTAGQGGVASIEPLFNPQHSEIAGVLAVLSVSPWLFVGFDAMPQTMGSLGQGARKTGFIMFSAIAVAAVLYIGLTVLAATAVPEGYSSWVAYVEDVPDLEGLRSLPVFYAVYATMGEAGLAAVEVATVCAALTCIIGFTYISCRLLGSMANIGWIPSWFGAKLRGRNVPLYSLFVILLGAFSCVMIGRKALGWIVDVSSVGVAIAFLYTSAATFKHARAQGRPAMQACGVAGMVLSAAFLVLLVAPIPGIGSALSGESYVVLLTWIALGINFYNAEEVRENVVVADRRPLAEGDAGDVA